MGMEYYTDEKAATQFKTGGQENFLKAIEKPRSYFKGEFFLDGFGIQICNFNGVLEFAYTGPGKKIFPFAFDEAENKGMESLAVIVFHLDFVMDLLAAAIGITEGDLFDSDREVFGFDPEVFDGSHVHESNINTLLQTRAQ
jgi:hypothetical protein